MSEQSLGRRLLRAFAAPAARLLRHPLTTVLLGLGLLLVGIIELLEGAFEEFKTVVELHHGFVLFGFVTLLRGLIELLEAAEFFSLNESELERQDAERAARPSDPPRGGSS
jgi:hypothetical protein